MRCLTTRVACRRGAGMSRPPQCHLKFVSLLRRDCYRQLTCSIARRSRSFVWCPACRESIPREVAAEQEITSGEPVLCRVSPSGTSLDP